VFVQLLLSLFGIVVVHRILSLFEKEEVFEVKKLRFTLIFLQIPLTFHLIFKDLTAFGLIYIGVFFVLLILSSKIIEIFRQKQFEKTHLLLLQRLILLISAGQSPKFSVKKIFDDLSAFEKRVYSPLITIFEDSKADFAEKSAQESFYYTELAEILNSNSHITEQLSGFRRMLSLQHNLRHRSRQTLMQNRAQAIVCAGLYMLLLTLSIMFLRFEWRSDVFAVSLLMQLSGLYFVFRTGRRISWIT
jgi:hypothetical protein